MRITMLIPYVHPGVIMPASAMMAASMFIPRIVSSADLYWHLGDFKREQTPPPWFSILGLPLRRLFNSIAPAGGEKDHARRFRRIRLDGSGELRRIDLRCR